MCIRDSRDSDRLAQLSRPPGGVPGQLDGAARTRGEGAKLADDWRQRGGIERCHQMHPGNARYLLHLLHQLDADSTPLESLIRDPLQALDQRIGDDRTVQTVSYTHLDVYKRQPRYCYRQDRSAP